jgi:hypothetical protein
MYGLCRIVLSLIGCVLFQELIAQTQPEAFIVENGSYFFHEWPADRPAGSYPPNMLFQQYAADATPKFDDEPVSDWLCTYNIETRSRIIGLGETGVGFINTSDVQDSEERCGNGTNARGGRVGIAVLALDTRGRERIEVEWKARLISQGAGLPTPREYRLTAQYRIDSTGEWKDLPNSSRFSSKGRGNGSFARYNVILPEVCNNKAYVQVRWKYYQENGNDGGARPMIALDDIRVFSSESNSEPKPVVFANKNELPLMGCIQGTEAKLQMFEVEGRNLAGPVIVSAPNGFRISLNPTGPFSNEVQISELAGTVFPTQVYVQVSCEEVRSYSGFIRIRSSNALEYRVNTSAETFAKLFINEFVASNLLSLQDPSSKSYPDWIEIYNPNDFNVSLSNYYMSDDVNNLTKSQIKAHVSQTIPAKSFKVYYAIGSSDANTHLNFSLSADGEQILLVGKDGITIIDSVSFGPQLKDISTGRATDGANEWFYLDRVSPAASNNSSVGYSEISGEPIFSHAGGVYGIPVNLQLQYSNPEAVIVYSIDGSQPNINNLGGTIYPFKDKYPYNAGELPFPMKAGSFKSFRYYEPIKLDELTMRANVISKIPTAAADFAFITPPSFPKIVVVKARVFEPNKLPGKIVTHSYVSNLSFNQNHQLDIISLSTQENGLFDYFNGIHVPGIDFDEWRLKNPDNRPNSGSPANYGRSGRATEREATIEVFEPFGMVKYKSDIGIRMHGNFSRAYVIKSFRLYARKSYENDFLNYPFFDDFPRQNFKTLLLRNSGQDFRSTYFKDAYSQVLIRHLPLDHQAYKPYVIYLNGEFWGLLNARERIDRHYLIDKYQLDSSNIDMLQYGRVQTIVGSQDHYNGLLNFIQNVNITTDASLEQLGTMMDIENYIDYYALKIFYATTDWPHNNIRFWRYRTNSYQPKAPFGMDGRWRWIMFDNDSGLSPELVNHNTLLWAVDPNGNDRGGQEVTLLFRTIMLNPRFQKMFYTRTADILNTAFLRSRMLKELENIQANIAHDFAMHIDRYKFPLSTIAWNREIENTVRFFANNRHEAIQSHYISYFGFTGMANIVLDVNDPMQGFIKINTIEINESTPGVNEQVYPWTGKYFSPMEIRCLPIPKPGHVFSHWEMDGRRINDDTLTFNFTKLTTIKAYFEPSDEYPYFPTPHNLAGCPFELTKWSKDTSGATYPASVAFVNTKYPDSRAEGEIFNYLEDIAFDHSSRTRINGLNEKGLSFINTTNANNNYQATRLGGMVVGLSTKGIRHASIEWISETIKANSKAYNIKLQYRIGDSGPFLDLKDDKNKVIEYQRSANEGVETKIGPFNLPASIMNQPYVQILFRYYYTGRQFDDNSDSRDEIRIDDIIIKQKVIVDSAAVGPYAYRISGNSNATFYQWMRCEGDSLYVLAGENKKDLRVTEPGRYALMLNYGECIDVSPCEYVYVKRLKSISDAIEANLFPNPATDKLTVSFAGNVEECFVRIFDTLGQLVHESFQGDKQSFSLDMSQYAPGTYFIQITDKQERYGNYKVVKQ